jgi:uncharacterized DUF497 family protein
MEFTWDQAKSERNRLERGLPFHMAVELFEGLVIDQVDDRQDYGELRVKAIGRAGGRILACVYTDRGNVRRIVSLRNASRRERDGYRSAFPR